MSKTTLDLSTLPDIADGVHTVKVKATADGYKDSVPTTPIKLYKQ